MSHLLALDNISKIYPGGVVASDKVNLALHGGQIHALLGENGAGKSTLVKIIYGLLKADNGSMRLLGKPYAPQNPHHARANGITMVFQHFSLFEALNVAENISLGMENSPKQQILAEKIYETSVKYGLALDPKRIVGTLSAGERQRVEIIRCLLQQPKVLIMDEPTSVLTPQEVETLFVTLRQLQSEGKSVLYISHKLEEIRTLCDQATILRRGRVVAHCLPADETINSLAKMMVGKSLQTTVKTVNPLVIEDTELIFKVDKLNQQSDDVFGTSLKDISFDLHSGEILAIAGIAGNGQGELMSVLSGEVAEKSHTIILHGEFIGTVNPTGRRLRGLLTAPEDRLRHAAAPDMSLTENTLLTGFYRQKLGKNGFINRQAAMDFTTQIIENFDVRVNAQNNLAKSLSGGNLQKFVIGREILQQPDVLIINQPTWGVDANAAAFIRQALLELAKKGTAIILISQDLDELLEICDTMAVLCGGRLSKVYAIDALAKEDIGFMMGSEIL